MKANLYINYYVDKNPSRHQENNICVARNILNDEIDRIFILIAPALVKDFEILYTNPSVLSRKPKIKLIHFAHQPTFNDYFEITRNHRFFNKKDGCDQLSIIANTDIYIKIESLKTLKGWHWNQRYCLALCRWDVKNVVQKTFKFFNRPDSQDCWIIKGVFPHIKEADFTLGKAGCDNKIAHLLSSYFKVINPSRDVVVYHLHLSGVRNYIHGKTIDRIKPPYLQIQPTSLNEA